MKPRNTQKTRKENSWNLFQCVPRIPRSGKTAAKSGMTLIELIITLSIMAAVASIALVTLSDMGATSRYEETERRGLAAQRAVIGQPGEISRFFNDMGRYPAVLSSDNAKVLAELYDIGLTSTSRYESIFLPSTFTNSLPSDADSATLLAAVTNTTMGAGWRGPYLFNRNETFKDYTDNWGRPWWVTSTNDYDAGAHTWATNALLNDLVLGMMSKGAGSGDYLSDPQVYPFYENSVCGTVRTSLISTNTYTNTVVFFYVPRCIPADAPELCEISVSASEVRFRLKTGWSETHAPSFVETDAVSEGLKSALFSKVPVGIRKIWAYAAGEGVTNWVRPQSIEVKPGDQLIQLYPEGF